MGSIHPQREQAIRRCLEQGEAPARVAKELGMAASTLRGWLRLARLERELAALRAERDAQQQRQEQLVTELQQAAAALAELRLLLDQAAPRAPRAAG
jgi:transposase-like protein